MHFCVCVYVEREIHTYMLLYPTQHAPPPYICIQIVQGMGIGILSHIQTPVSNT